MSKAVINQPFERAVDEKTGFVKRVKERLHYGLNVPNSYRIDNETGKRQYMPNRARRRMMDKRGKNVNNNRGSGYHLRKSGKRVHSRELQVIGNIVEDIFGKMIFKTKTINHGSAVGRKSRRV